MAFEQRDMSGSLFKNDKEGGNPNWPDYKGQIMVGGVSYWLSAWIKESPSTGKKYMSLSVQAKDASRSRQEQRQPQRQPEAQPDFDDSIPF